MVRGTASTPAYTETIYSKNIDESLDECRQVQTNVDESWTNVDECRQVQASHQTSVSECRRVTRRVQTSVDESVFFSFIPKKVTHGRILLLLRLCNSRPHWYVKFSIFNAEDLDFVMPMYNLLKFSKNYSKATGSFWNYYRDEPNSGVDGANNNINYYVSFL